ncbi:MAG: ribonuclease III [Phycisphaeraceae bacterium]
MLEKANKALGYRFKDESLLKSAMTHASVAETRLHSNERMEFLGDAILGYVVSEYLFDTFPTYLEGELTKIKSAVVSRRACAKISEELDLISMLSLGKGMNAHANLPSSVAAAVLESIIAAIYMDGGLRPARKFILKHMAPLIVEAAKSTHQENYKSALQHYAQKNMPCNPSYVLLDEKGPDHCKAFQVCVEIDGDRFGPAWANSKKDAEQQAALIAMGELRLISTNEEGIVIIHEAPIPAVSKRKRKAKDHDGHEPEVPLMEEPPVVEA